MPRIEELILMDTYCYVLSATGNPIHICDTSLQVTDYQYWLILNKKRFLQEIEPKWIEEARKKGKLIEI